MNNQNDIVTQITVPTTKKTTIETKMESLIYRYLCKDNITEITEPIDFEDMLLSEYGYDFDIKKVDEFYPTLRNSDKDILGCTDFDKKLVIVDAELYENNPKRANFTLGHEITHIELHEKYYQRYKIQGKLDFEGLKDQPSFICRDYDVKKEKKPTVEWQADYGASILLMSKELLLHYWKDLKSEYSEELNDNYKPEEEKQIIFSLAASFSDIINASKESLRYRIQDLGLETFGFIREGGGKQLNLFGM